MLRAKCLAASSPWTALFSLSSLWGHIPEGRLASLGPGPGLVASPGSGSGLSACPRPEEKEEVYLPFPKLGLPPTARPQLLMELIPGTALPPQCPQVAPLLRAPDTCPRL